MKLRNRVNPCPFSSIFVPIVLLFSASLLRLITTCLSASGNETDVIALLKFKDSISSDPHGILRSWNDSARFCEWPGVSCSARGQRITALDLQGYNLRGIVSPFVGNLTFLRFINLRNNSFFGEIPQHVGHLSRLQHLNLSDNALEGKIPLNLSRCSQLTMLSLKSNRLTGSIPPELGSLGKLFYLSLSQNNLTGKIPASLGNISSLAQFSVAYNNLEGNVPDELGRLKNLTFFAIGPNNLTGTVPHSLYNISSMSTFSLTDNEFNGTLPSDIGLTLPNLQSFGIGGNEFSGAIPESFANASQLQILDISENNFFGKVPKSLGTLPNLQWLGLSSNNIGNYSTDSLNFISYLTNCSQLEILDLSLNNFGGVLPNSVTNLSTQLHSLYFGVNQISGTIPAAMENLVNLVVLGMTDNLFTGIIPSSLGKLQNLQILDLEWNAFSGTIPSSIGNLTQTFQLYLSHNKLEGSIPPNIIGCQSLQLLDISHNNLEGAIPREVFSLSSLSVLLNLSRNSLTGSLPVEVGKLKNIDALDLSENNLINEIPETIGDCQTLEFLYLQGNHFLGSLPSTLGSLSGLQYLDLSRNNLTGKIPEGLQKLSSLQYLNLSFNTLEGEVPNRGVFQNSSAVSLVGNSKLCGGVTKLQLPACPVKVSKQGMSRGLKLTIIVVGAAAFFLLFSIIVFLYWRRKPRNKKSSAALWTIALLPKVEYKQLYQATNGFSPTMLIGTGSFGSVYKGNLQHEENPVAVKVLNLNEKGADKSFDAECNALRNIRHRNLVKILTCCSSIDYSGNEFKALVFEYMPNGSLEKWIHPVASHENQLTSLNLIQRLNIVHDVASALYYLHDQCDQPIIHCDLKPSNVLLDNEMIARISDFGLARLISNTARFSESQARTTGIKGTIGYAAPEYAMGGLSSKRGDAYSFGILVLEMFTGKRPTDEMFKDGFNLHNFVKMALPERLAQIVDSTLLPREVEGTSASREVKIDAKSRDIGIEIIETKVNFEEQDSASTNQRSCLVSILEIGLACSSESAKDRMNMGDVARELQLIRDAYTGVRINGQRQRTN